ncbi:MAG: prepilin-type N-terminal cleavage/methylation domain-containing protein [Planctomycetales bacterium]|nr:prepilin-type N-terminal cleavage/methylation domain-containing protein [Planctomycetales bacterium]
MKVKGFTLIELMVVILIVGILAAASVPMMRGRIDSAKWSEANATAGTIKSAVRVYFAEHGESPTGAVTGTNMSLLGFTTADLTGTYFLPADYSISSVDSNGNAAITVTSDGSGNKPAAGTKTLSTTGTWN